MALSSRAGSAGQHGGLGAGTGTVGHGLGCSNAVLFRPVPVLAQRAWPIWPSIARYVGLVATANLPLAHGLSNLVLKGPRFLKREW